jgi:hypothetical protein
VSRRWAVILAGGDGVRLRSMTRGITGDERPKQFCALVTEDTLLTETRRRVAQTVPAHRTLVVVNRAHERFYVPLLADMRVPAVMAQPENRGTAAAILYALLVLASRRAAGDTVAFYPSDHFVSDAQSWLWNSFVMVGRMRTLLALVRLAVPDLHRSFAEVANALGRWARPPRSSACTAGCPRSISHVMSWACAPTASRCCRCGEYTGTTWASRSACWRRGGGPGACPCDRPFP